VADVHRVGLSGGGSGGGSEGGSEGGSGSGGGLVGMFHRGAVLGRVKTARTCGARAASRSLAALASLDPTCARRGGGFAAPDEKRAR
jgi:hypothetical protein